MTDTNSLALQPESDPKDRKLATIFEISKIIAAQHDLEIMLPSLLSCLVDNMENADAGVLWQWDPEEEVLGVHVSNGYDQEHLKVVRLSCGEGIPGAVIQSGRTLLLSSAEVIWEYQATASPHNLQAIERAAASRPAPQCCIAIPLNLGDSKLGVLALENRHGSGCFGEEDKAFLEAIADLIALSIDSVELRKQLQRTQALSEANRLKAELISILAHEMRTPLTSIKGYSTALLMEEASFSLETQREFLHIIDEECDTLQDLIRDLLESSIIDAGLLQLEMQPVLLPKLVESVIGDVTRRSKIHRAVIDFSVPFPIVEADPDRVAQVMRNLLDNAVKYSPRGGLVVVRGDVGDGEVIISVADQGLGIAPQDLNRLFERFFRAQTGIGRHVVGSGLGLPIARTIVESHGGRIWAESQVGLGSTFYFTLPLSSDLNAVPDMDIDGPAPPGEPQT